MHITRIAGFVLGGVIGLAPAVWAEDLTLTTYYPSPRGVYELLQTRSLQDFDSLTPYLLDLDQRSIMKELEVTQLLIVDNDFEVKRNFDANTTGGTTDLLGPTTVDDTLHVTGNTDLDALLNVDGNTDLQQNLHANIAGGTTELEGATTVDDTLTVTGLTTLQQDLRANTLGGTTTLNGATTIDDTLHVTGATDLDATLNVDQLATFNQGIKISAGDLEVEGAVKAWSVRTPNSEAVTLDSDLTGVGNITASGDVRASTFTGGSFTGSSLDVTGLVEGGRVLSRGNVRANNDVIADNNVTATATVTGKNVTATETVTGKNVTATETVLGKTVAAGSGGFYSLSGGVSVQGDIRTTADVIGKTVSGDKLVARGAGLSVAGGGTINGGLTVDDVNASNILNGEFVTGRSGVCVGATCKSTWPVLTFSGCYNITPGCGGQWCGADEVVTGVSFDGDMGCPGSDNNHGVGVTCCKLTLSP